MTDVPSVLVPINLLTELADDAADFADAQYGRSLEYPSYRRRYEAAMRPVREARAIIAAAGVKP